MNAAWQVMWELQACAALVLHVAKSHKPRLAEAEQRPQIISAAPADADSTHHHPVAGRHRSGLDRRLKESSP
jgi:hypothetical protein